MRELALTMAANGGEQAEDLELTTLLKRAKAGDASAFEQILIRHERRVFLTALRLLGQVEDAQDASQEVFLRLHRYLRRFDEVRAFAPWLYRMTVNVCRDIARRRRNEPAAIEGRAGNPPDFADRLEREDQLRVVKEGLKTLPEKERAAIVLRDIEGIPTTEVARILGSSEATVRSQLSSARLKIRRFAGRFQRRRL